MSLSGFKEKIKEKHSRAKRWLFNDEKVNTTLLYILFACFTVLLLWGIVFKCNFNDLLMIEEKRGASFEERFTTQLIPIQEIRAFINNGRVVGILAYFLNFIALIPFGFLFRFIADEKHLLIYTFALILGIEIFQFFSYFGVFDFADILLNVLGAFVGSRICGAVKPKLNAKIINTVCRIAVIPLILASFFAIVRTIVHFPV